MTGKLILCRHGQSEWNLKNLFTGWHDVDLTAKGIEEAKEAGRLLDELDYNIDIAFTSVLKRAIRTLWLMLDEMDRMWIPVVRDWRLNERHYGALQGLNKAETAEKYGAEQVISGGEATPLRHRHSNLTMKDIHPTMSATRESLICRPQNHSRPRWIALSRAGNRLLFPTKKWPERVDRCSR